MQLKTLVLPAPFGPISANSSPAWTANDTESSTTSPPKRSVRLTTSSSAIPPPAPAVLFDRSVTAPLTSRLAEIEILDVWVVAQSLRRAVKHDAAALEHVAVVRDSERGC